MCQLIIDFRIFVNCQIYATIFWCEWFVNYFQTYPALISRACSYKLFLFIGLYGWSLFNRMYNCMNASWKTIATCINVAFIKLICDNLHTTLSLSIVFWSGLVPLHNACSYGHFEVTELLLKVRHLLNFTINCYYISFIAYL